MIDLRADKKEMTLLIIGAVITLLTVLLITPSTAAEWITGYLLGLLSVVFHYGSIWWMRNLNMKQFMEGYYLGLFVRFFLILLLFTSFLLLTSFEQISFTLSFIFSYIFHSVIDIILINRKI